MTAALESYYSVRVLEPFRRAIAGLPGDHQAKFDAIDLEPDGRLAAGVAHAMLTAWVERTRDPDLGLRAGRMVCAGSFGVVDHAMRSAPTLRAAIETASRFSRLVSDTIEPALQPLSNELVLLRVQRASDWPRAAGDYTLSAWFYNHLRAPLTDDSVRGVWFAHESPADALAYEETFGQVSLRFDAPCYGFVLRRDALELPLIGRDAGLHALLCAHAQVRCADLGRTQRVVGRVRRLMLDALPRGNPSVQDIAMQLGMSQRTLFRRLHAEGSSFGDELERLRRQLALEYVATGELPFAEIATLLGFSHVAGFHRAFKRWTRETPGKYRRAQSGARVPAAASPG
ncbi:MAG TPA: AraC family transcriptional regulator ligand-binding domain-containing protein [Polyangiales bacterium]|nr:AraC family transcriptional regulator ligand-binding domain-containing protein [Polyangiales bacterium]